MLSMKVKCITLYYFMLKFHFHYTPLFNDARKTLLRLFAKYLFWLFKYTV